MPYFEQNGQAIEQCFAKTVAICDQVVTREDEGGGLHLKTGRLLDFAMAFVQEILEG